MPTIHRFSACLWFDQQAEEAVRFYTKVFPRSSIGRIARYGEAGREVHHQEPGTVMTVEFELDGHHFTALNGGPEFKFGEAISFQIFCESQADLDYFWEKLSDGGDPSAQQCGWLKDRFGVSWQVIPAGLPAWLGDHDHEKANRTMAVMMKMKKLDAEALRRAHDGTL